MTYIALLGAVCCGLAMMGRESGILPLWLGLVLGIAAVGLLVYGSRYGRIWLAVGLIVCAGALGIGRMEWAMRQYEALPHYLANAKVVMQGKIVTEKRAFMTEKGMMARYVVASTAFAYEDDGLWRPMEGCIYLTVPQDEALVPQTPIQFTGTLKEITYYRNDGMYDSLHRDREQEIFLKAYSDESGSVQRLGEPQGWQAVVHRLRESLTNTYKTVLRDDQAHILSSLLFGGHYEDIPPAVIESFSTTGLIHILSVSGSHMALLLSVIQLLGKALGLQQRSLFAVSLVFVLAYGAMAEFTAPVVRSAVMGLVAAYSLTAERSYLSYHALGVAMLGMLLYSPYLVYDLSFRLSCGASAGIVLLQPRLVPYIQFLPTFLRNALGVCLCAQALVLPLICANFFALPVYTVLANVTVAPVLDIVIMLGLAASLVSVVVPLVAEGILYGVGVLLDIALTGNDFLASLPYSRYWVGAMPIWYSLSWYLAIGSWFVPRHWGRPLRFTACCLALGGILWSYYEQEDAKVFIFDVGNDRAMCVIFPDKSSYVWYNKSEWSNPEQASVVLTPALQYHGIFRLTGCTVTGHKAAHTGSQLAAKFSIDSPIQYESSSLPVTVVQGDMPYILYETNPQGPWPKTGCLELRTLTRWKDHQFPQNASALIVHGKTGRTSEVYTEWLEQAEALDIPVFSPQRDGQITGIYRQGTWIFRTYGGERY